MHDHDALFLTYPSNIAIGTSHNYILCYDAPRRLRARGYFLALSSHTDTWRFWFSNAVDTTFADGAVGHPDRLGGHWRILSARIGDGGPYTCGAMPTPAPVTNWTTVSFAGQTEKDVTPGERFWSDAVLFSLPEGHYLVWEWELEGNDIPCTPDSQAPTFVSYGDDDLQVQPECPLPDLFGAKRDVKNRVAFWGDSITQGCGTRNNYYEHWSAQVARMLGEEYSFWNIGLGWARGSDAAYNEYWKYKAAQVDTVCIVHGVNDTNSGRYGKGHGDSADEILTTLETNIRYLQKHGVRVILFTVPPFEYPGDRYMVWKTLRYAYPALAAEMGVDLFDFAATLDARPPYGNRFIHGAHPDGEGGRIAAEAFVQSGLLER